MIWQTENAELRLSYETGVLDGIMMIANVVDGFDDDRPCKTTMVTTMHEIARKIAVRRSRFIAHLLLDDFP